MSTRTSTFGSSRRESHDARPFYERFDKVVESTDTLVNPPKEVNKIYCATSEDMYQIADNSVALSVTSPPYHVGKDYDTDHSFDEYLDMLYTVFQETQRVLIPGGRMAVNVANLGRKPMIPLTTYVDAMAMELGMFPRGHIVWVKAKGASGSCAWGTFRSAKNPVLRDVNEYILVYSNGRFGRLAAGESTISKFDFLRDTLSVWEFPPERASKIGHPAPFPVELPRRLINLYTYKDDLVLDQFMGAGATAVAALELGRHYVGYDTDASYCHLAEERIKDFVGGTE